MSLDGPRQHVCHVRGAVDEFGVPAREITSLEKSDGTCDRGGLGADRDLPGGGQQVRTVHRSDAGTVLVRTKVVGRNVWGLNWASISPGWWQTPSRRTPVRSHPKAL